MKLYLKLSIFLTIFFIIISCPLSAWNSEDGDSEYFKLTPPTDGMLFGCGILLTAADIAVEKISEPAGGWALDTATDIHRENLFDCLFAFPYSEPLDTASDIFTYSALLAPAVLVAAPNTEWFTIGTMYAESVIWAWGLKELGKNIVHRNRPYMYFDDYPQDEIAGGDFQQSFPSGHTTLAFNGAGFCTFVFSRYFKDSPWKMPVIAASYSLAAGSAIMRVASGSHFLTDVLAGAVIGTFTGFILPWLHTLNIEPPGGAEPGIKSLSVAVIPPSINVKLSL